MQAPNTKSLAARRGAPRAHAQAARLLACAHLPLAACCSLDVCHCIVRLLLLFGGARALALAAGRCSLTAPRARLSRFRSGATRLRQRAA